MATKTRKKFKSSIGGNWHTTLDGIETAVRWYEEHGDYDDLWLDIRPYIGVVGTYHVNYKTIMASGLPMSERKRLLLSLADPRVPAQQDGRVTVGRPKMSDVPTILRIVCYEMAEECIEATRYHSDSVENVTPTESEIYSKQQRLVDVHARCLSSIMGSTTWVFKDEWRTSTVVDLAKEITAKEQFNLIPILSDALQDAGCNDGSIFAHCRDTSVPWTNGAWVLRNALGM